MRGRIGTAVGFLIFICIAGPRALRSQDTGLQVRVQASNGIPLSGALVALIDQQNVAQAEGLTSEAGTRTLSAPPGTYRVRVRRIGYQPFISDPVTIPRSSELLLQVDNRKVVLSAMVIRGNTKCGKFDKDNEQLATVWEEISKALLSSKLTGSDLESLGRARIYRKQIDAGGVVVASDTTYVGIKDRAPFSAVDPAILAAEGYVKGNPRNGWTYYGVDESILLSQAFSETHCFHLVKDKKRPGQIGMAFEPARGQKKSDVKGVLWLDENASELRDVVFTFTNAGLLSQFQAGGATKFRRLPSGAWIVEEWSLRAPKLVIMTLQMRGDRISVSGYVEDGGGVVVSSMPKSTLGKTGLLRGVVFDSISMRPIVGASVTASGTTASSDSLGRFAFTGIPVADQTVTFAHPSFSALGFLALERDVAFAGDTVDIVLATPSMKTLWVRICGDTLVKVRGSWEETSLLHGTVRDSAGNPVDSAVVKMFWAEYSDDVGDALTDPSALKQETTTDAMGHYAVCGFSRRVRGTMYAVANGKQTPRRDFALGRLQRINRIDLAFVPTATSALHEIVVTVKNASGGVLSDAIVFVEGTGQTARTDDSGVAVLRTTEKQPVIGARRLGFAEQSVRVTLGISGKHQLPITLYPVQTLATVPVHADALLPLELQRRRDQGGTGTFFGREELDRVVSVQNLMTRVPFAQIRANRGIWTVSFPVASGMQLGYCAADLYVDGVLSPGDGTSTGKLAELQTLSPDDIAAIEVYPNVGQAPQNGVRLRGGCGVILVWTKYWAETRRPLRAPKSDSTQKR